jgi:betaine-homocysteine S-methyltransferase
VAKGLLDRLRDGFVLGDGGYLMALRLRGFVQKDAMTPQVVDTHPEEVTKLTREFREAGADVLQTLTFFGTRNMLGEQAEELNRSACRIAREVAGGDRLVAGNLNSPSISYKDYDPEDERKRDRTRAWLDEQLLWICDESIDFLILETFSWLDEALLAVDIAKQTGRTLVTTVSLEGEGDRTFDGYTPSECARRLADAGSDVVGLNCICPPGRLLQHAAAMRASVEVPICCQPSAWHSWWEEPAVTPEAFGEFTRRAMEEDIRFIGSCCGAGPEHVAEMATAMGRHSDR